MGVQPMFRRTFSGASILLVCLLSIGLQLPTQMDSSSYFGVFGAELIPVKIPDCNAIAPKTRNCQDLNPNCKFASYIAGPLSADEGGVNTKRYVKSGKWLVCELRQKGEPNQPFAKVELYHEAPGKCTPVKVPWNKK